MTDTLIEWADKVWNPVTGCTKVSAGCKHCYAETMAKRTFRVLYADVPSEDGEGGYFRSRRFTDVQTHADEYWVIDESRIRRDVENFKGERKIPGVRQWKESRPRRTGGRK